MQQISKTMQQIPINMELMQRCLRVVVVAYDGVVIGVIDMLA